MTSLHLQGPDDSFSPFSFTDSLKIERKNEVEGQFFTDSLKIEKQNKVGGSDKESEHEQPPLSPHGFIDGSFSSSRV